MQAKAFSDVLARFISSERNTYMTTTNLNRRRLHYRLFPMKFIIKCFLLLILLNSAAADPVEFIGVAVSSDELSWTKVSEKVWYAQITGKKNTPGMYVYRVKFGKGHRNEPHYHTDERVVTILSGSIYVGFGEEFKESEMVKLYAGGIYTEPKNFPHYVWAKDGDVVLQVVGSGSSKRVSLNSKNKGR